MIVMQYANNGSLPSYLYQNINKLTWKMKLQYLRDIAGHLNDIHTMSLIHCDLHGGNIVFNDNKYGQSTKPLICDLGLSKFVNSSQSTTSTVQGVLPYIAPEVLHSHKFTQKSDIYSFGIIMYQIADGEPPFRNWLSDDNLLAMRICNGLRPEMPDSAPDEYEKLAKRCL
jgi:serine/threonine protein kinase